MSTLPHWDALPQDNFAVLYSSSNNEKNSFTISSSFQKKSVCDDVNCSSDSMLCVRLAYNTFGEPSNPCLLLIQDAGCPGLYWDERFCELLARKGSFFVVRYDQRDTGRTIMYSSSAATAYRTSSSTAPNSTSTSTMPSSFKSSLSSSVVRHLKQNARNFLFSPLSILRQTAAQVSASYKLSDLAQDVLELMNKLHISMAHFVGLGLGTVVIQHLLMDAPERALSATLISPFPVSPSEMKPSTWRRNKSDMWSSVRSLRSPGASNVLSTQPTVGRAQAFAKDEVENYWRWHYGNEFTFPEDELYERALWSYDRHSPEENAVAQHLAAYLSTPEGCAGGLEQLNLCCDRIANGNYPCSQGTTDFTNRLLWNFYRLLTHQGTPPKELCAPPSIEKHIPVLFICGGQNKVFSLEQSEQLARRIAGSTLVCYPNMGHIVPAPLFSDVVDDIICSAQLKGRSCVEIY